MLLLHDADDYSAPGSWRRTAAALPRVLDTLARARPASRSRRELLAVDARRRHNIISREHGHGRYGLAQNRPRRRTGTGAGPPVVKRPRWWVELLVIGWLLWVYDAINNLAPLRLSAALHHAEACSRSSGRCTSILSAASIAGSPPTARSACCSPTTTTTRISSSRSACSAGCGGSGLTSTARCATRCVLANLIAFVVFWRYPVAPPRMLPGFTDVVAATGAIGSWHTGALASQANELAAMPSLHMAWAVWCSIVMWKLSPRLLGPRDRP